MTRTKIQLDHVALFLASVYVLAAVADTVGLSIPLVFSVVGFLLFGFVPGALVLVIIDVRPRLDAFWIVYSIGMSLVVVTAVGLILNLSLPVLGHTEPLSFVPLVLAHLWLVGSLIAWVRSSANDRSVEVVLPESLDEIDPRVPFLLLLPLFGALAVTYLNVFESNVFVLCFLAFAAIIPILVVLSYFDEDQLPLAIWTVALGVLFHKSIWINSAFGGHASVVGIWKTGYWPLQGETLLVNAILMPAMAYLTGMFILTMVKIVLPLFVSFIPVALYLSFKRYTTPKQAFLGANLFVFAHPFYYQYVSSPRSGIPVLFLVLLGTIVSDNNLTVFQKHALSIPFALGLIVSHYGTSYYVMFALLGTVGILYLVWNADDIWSLFARLVSREDNTDYLDEIRAEFRGSRLSNITVMTYSFVGFYLVAILSYYLAIDGGSKFVALTEHVINTYTSLFVESGSQGATATRLKTDYGSMSIDLSKYLYVTIGALLGVGLLVECGRWLGSRYETKFDEEYLAMAAMLFFLFGGTLIISGNWGGGRPMMIVFSFCAIFPVIAVDWIGERCLQFLEKFRLYLGGSRSESTARSFQTGSAAAFAILLAVFLMLNTGAASALVYGGEAPSNVPAKDPDTIYLETDVRTHVWLADHRNARYQVYGDRLARAQTTDWINGEIRARSERKPYRFKKKYFFGSLNDSVVETGYVILLGHNIIDDRVEVNYITSRPIEVYQLSLDERNKVYASGFGAVYFYPKPPDSAMSGPPNCPWRFDDYCRRAMTDRVLSNRTPMRSSRSDTNRSSSDSSPPSITISGA